MRVSYVVWFTRKRDEVHVAYLVCDKIPVFMNQLDLLRRKRSLLVDVLREIGLIPLFYQHLDPCRRGGCASSSPHPTLRGSFSRSNIHHTMPPMTALCPFLLPPSVCFYTRASRCRCVSLVALSSFCFSQSALHTYAPRSVFYVRVNQAEKNKNTSPFPTNK